MTDAEGDLQPTIPLPGGGATGTQPMPERVGPYRCLRRLGEGGMGLVVEAEDSRDGSRVALKLLRQELAGNAEFVERFRREAAAGSRLHHPNIVAIREIGEADGLLFMACQLVTGTDLADLARRKHSLTEAKACKLIAEACRGLQALADAGLVHRDIKPGNLFVDEAGHVLIGDLGLVRQADGDDKLTATGTAMGTPAYMSPEHIQGRSDLDIRTDIYALGATLYRLVTGQEPFPGDTLYVVTHKILTEAARDPRRLNPSLSAEVTAIIAKAMAKDRDERYLRPSEMLTDLNCASQGRSLLHAFVSRGPLPTGERPASDRTVSSTATMARPRRSQVSGLRLPWTVIPPGLRRVLVLAVFVVALGWVLGRLPGWLTPAVSDGPGRPAWAASLQQDAFGHRAQLQVADTRIALRWCPPGSFTMGSPLSEPERGDGEARRPVTISRGFWISGTECTRAFYRAVRGEATEADLSGNDQLPIDNISWQQAMDFCQRLNQIHPGLDARLPTEAEWEYACRAGSNTAHAPTAAEDDRPLGWFAEGELAAAYEAAFAHPYRDFAPVHDLLARHAGADGYRSRPVGLSAANAWGLSDMHGNLAEWCLDAVDEQPPAAAPAIDPLATDGPLRVLRGGSWSDPPAWGRAASRDLQPPDRQHPSIGFRFIIPGPRTATGQDP